jgi:inosine/xanthosine triphosphate pyrophosphatase family protein
MKQILIATTNPGKIYATKQILAKLGYEGLSFADLNLKLDEPDETQLTAEEIAAEKALGYAKQFKDMPVLSRDDTNELIGVDEEDDPKNHNKAFVARRKGKYTDDLGSELFAEIAHKYGGSIPCRFVWGYGLAWHDGGEIKVVHDTAQTDPKNIKLVDKISPKRVPGFSFSPVMQVLIDGEWKYDSELEPEDNWAAYWNIQAETIKKLLDQLEK